MYPAPEGPDRAAVHIGKETYLGVVRGGKELSNFDFLNESAEAMLDDLIWRTRTLRAARATEAKTAECTEAAR